MFNTNTFENRYNLGDLLSNSINELFDNGVCSSYQHTCNFNSGKFEYDL